MARLGPVSHSDAMSGESRRSLPPITVALTIWIAMVGLVGIGGALARVGSSSKSGAAASATSTTAKSHVSHTAPPTSSMSSSEADVDYAALLVDVAQFGYREVPTSVSGVLTADRLAQLAGSAMPASDLSQSMEDAGYKGGYLRVSRSADGSTIVEQFVLDFGSITADAHDFADGLALGAARFGSDAQQFDVPFENGFGETLTIKDTAGTHPAVIVEYTLGGRYYVDFALARTTDDPLGPDDVLRLAQAQIDHG